MGHLIGTAVVERADFGVCNSNQWYHHLRESFMDISIPKLVAKYETYSEQRFGLFGPISHDDVTPQEAESCSSHISGHFFSFFFI